MKKVIVANHNKTLIPDPFEVEIVRDEYQRRWLGEYEIHRGKPWIKEARDHLAELERGGVYVEAPFPGVAEFLHDLRERSLGFVLFAGAPAHVLRDKYTSYGLLPYIDGFYGTKEERFAVEGDRDNPEAFRRLAEVLRAEDLQPVAYVSNNRRHVETAACSWGKGFVVELNGIERTEGGIYMVTDWTKMRAETAASFLGL